VCQLACSPEPLNGVASTLTNRDPAVIVYNSPSAAQLAAGAADEIGQARACIDPCFVWGGGTSYHVNREKALRGRTSQVCFR